MEFQNLKVRHKLSLNFLNLSFNNKKIKDNIIKQMNLLEIKINLNHKLNISYKLIEYLAIII